MDYYKYEEYLMVGIPYLAAVGSIGVFLCTRGEEVGWCDKSCRGGFCVTFGLNTEPRRCPREAAAAWGSSCGLLTHFPMT